MRTFAVIDREEQNAALTETIKQHTIMLVNNSLLLILQASSMTITLGLALALCFAKFHQPDTTKEYEQMRWVNVAALLIMAIHYALQMLFGFRAQGPDVGALINILFYSTSICIFSYSFIRLAGRPSFQRRFITVVSIFLAIIFASFAMGYTYYGGLHMPVALYVMGASFFLSTLFCFLYPAKEIRRALQLADDESGQLQVQYSLFLKTSSRLLYIATLAMSLSIYFTPLLFIVGILNLVAFLFFIVSFIALGFNIGNVSQVISTENEEPTSPDSGNAAEDPKPTLTDEQKQSIGLLIADWRRQQGYGVSELNSTSLASRLNVPKRQLVQYLREVEGKTFRVWLSDLRLAEAKQLIIAHPEYSNETIAESCGFSRSHLQAKFKESTGLTTNEWRDAHVQPEGQKPKSTP